MRRKVSKSGMHIESYMKGVVRNVDNDEYRNNFVHRKMNAKERAAIKRQAEIDFIKYEKRKKFRGLAYKFIEWRESKDET